MEKKKKKTSTVGLEPTISWLEVIRLTIRPRGLQEIVFASILYTYSLSSFLSVVACLALSRGAFVCFGNALVAASHSSPQSDWVWEWKSVPGQHDQVGFLFIDFYF